MSSEDVKGFRILGTMAIVRHGGNIGSDTGPTVMVNGEICDLPQVKVQTGICATLPTLLGQVTAPAPYWIRHKIHQQDVA